MVPLSLLTVRGPQEFGCHLTVMELYEKLFLFLWLWLVLLTAATLCHILYLAMFWLPYFRMRMHRMYKVTSG